jgi:hypothetical protein
LHWISRAALLTVACAVLAAQVHASEPTADLTASPSTVTEGTTQTVTVAFRNQSDDPADMAAGFRYSFDFDNDGTWDVGDGTLAGSVKQAWAIVPPAFLQSDGIWVLGRILDPSGAYNDYWFPITVNNVAPVISNLAISKTTINEGETVTLTGAIIDPGTRDYFSILVDFGDGTGESWYDIPVGSTHFSVDHAYVYSPNNGEATQQCTISVLNFQDSSGAEDTTGYSFDVTVNNVVPTVAISTGGLLGKYYDGGGNLVLTRVDPVVDFYWYSGSPSPSVPSDYFSANWTGTFTAPASGDYVFATVSDDGSNLWVDGTHVVDSWYDHGNTWTEGHITLTAGQSYPLQMDFYEASGDSTARLLWLVPGAADWETMPGQVFRNPALDTTQPVWSAPESISAIGVMADVTDPGVDESFTYAWSVTKNDSEYTNSTFNPGPFDQRGFFFTPDDHGTYVVTLTVNDGNGGEATTTRTIDILASGPQVQITSAPATMDEGSTVTLNSSVLDSVADMDAGFTYVWGVTKNGSTYPVSVPTDGSSFDFSPEDNGTYVVTLNVTDMGNVTGSASVTIFVLNISPSIDTYSLLDSVTDDDPFEGGTTVLTATFVDPGILDTHEVTVDWGDGTPPTVINLAAGILEIVKTDNVSHVYTQDGYYNFALTIKDKDYCDPFPALANRSFETGDLTGWTRIPGDNGYGSTVTVTSSETSDGKYCVQFDVPDQDSDDGWKGYTDSLRSSTFHGVAGTSVSFDWYDYSDDWSFRRAQLFSSTGALVHTFFNDFYEYTEEWTTESFVLSADGDYYLEFQGGTFDESYEGAAGGYLLIDNIAPIQGFGIATDDEFWIDNVTPSDITLALKTDSNGDDNNFSNPVNEGQSVTLICTFADPGTLDTHVVTIEWGDDTDDTVIELAAGVLTIPATQHTYADNWNLDPGTITVTVEDDYGDSDSNTIDVYVNNVIPTIDSLTITDPAAAPYNEGVAITVTPAVTDPGNDGSGNDGLSYAWDVSKDGTSGFATGSEATFTFTPDDQGAYVVSLTVTDNDGDSDTKTLPVTVLEVAPSPEIIPAAGNSNVVNTAQSFTINPHDGAADGPFTYTWTITENATSNTTTGDQTAPITFTPTKFGIDAYTITVTNFKDKNLVAGSDASLNLTITRDPPVVTIVTDQAPTDPAVIDESGSVTVSGTFTDASGATSHTATIDWGDGSPIENMQVVGTVLGSITHTYVHTGSYTAQVAVTATDLGTPGSTTTNVVVNNVLPSVTIDPVTGTLEQRQTITFTATVTDPGNDITNYYWEVVDSNGYYWYGYDSTFDFSLPHGGTYTVYLEVYDENDDYTDADPIEFTVNAPPVITDIWTNSAYEGGTAELWFDLDQPPADDLTLTVDWGDGSAPEAITLTADGSTYEFVAQHKYVDDKPSGTFKIRATVADKDGRSTPLATDNLYSASVGALQGTPLTVDDPDVTSVLEGIDDSTSYIDFDGRTFTLYGTTYSGLWVSSNGALWSGDNSVYSNDDLADGPHEAGIAVLWDDLVTYGDIGAVLYKISGSTLIVQWNARYISSDSDAGSDIQFQAVLGLDTGNTNGSITLNYFNIDSHDEYANGAESTFGVKDDSSSQYTTYSNEKAVPGLQGKSLTWASEGWVPVEIYNSSPSITNLTANPTTVAQGAPLQLTVNFTDDGIQDAHTIHIDWNDDTEETFEVAAGVTSYTATHIYTSEVDSYEIDVEVYDDSGDYDDDYVYVEVINAAPTVTNLAVANAYEAAEITLTGTLADTYVDDDFNVQIDWGDGCVTQDFYDADETDLSETHTYVDSGTYTIAVMLWNSSDEDTWSLTTYDAVIANVAPVVTATLTQAGTLEGSKVVATVSGSFTDVGVLDYSWAVSIDWGDGSNFATEFVNEGDPQKFGPFTHTYTNEPVVGGVYAVKVTVTDKDGGAGTTLAGNVAITNVAPTVAITGVPSAPTKGTNVSLTATATDPGATDTFTYQWTVLKDGAAYKTGSGAVLAFVLPDYGQYDVTCTATDDGGATGSATVSLNAADLTPAPTIASLTANPNPATVGQAVQFSVAAAENITVSWKWDFGDGVTDSSGSDSVQHTFTPAGTYTVTVSGTSSGGTTTKTISLVVQAATGGAASAPGENDSDGDGISDAVEIAMGSDPSNAKSYPTASSNPTPEALLISKMSIKLSFVKPGSDSIQISGLLPMKAGVKLSGQKLLLNVGGVLKTFTLNEKGSAVSGGSAIKLGVKLQAGVTVDQTAKFAVKLSKGGFAAALADDGFTKSEAASALRKLLVQMLFDGTIYQDTKTLFYTAKANVSGSAK